MFTNFGSAEAVAALKMAKIMREAGVAVEVFPDSSKIQKQMKYANAVNIPFVAIIGESELAEGKMTLKNMATGEQKLVSVEEAIELVK